MPQVLTMSVTDTSGVTHPNAVAVPATVVMDNLDLTGGVDMVFYHDASTYLAHDAPISVQHHIALDTPLYAQVVSFPLPPGLTTYGEVTAAALIYLAMNVKDTPAKNADGSPEIDTVTGQPVMVSFFADATVASIG